MSGLRGGVVACICGRLEGDLEGFLITPPTPEEILLVTEDGTFIVTEDGTLIRIE